MARQRASLTSQYGGRKTRTTGGIEGKQGVNCPKMERFCTIFALLVRVAQKLGEV
ncbi:hypothetical protein [Cognatishimia sp.]|uniref:hypothetical protein n=1 Tax=Cognatishimia sp. TaxID=2211648 RepID=UPI0035184E98|nr:hypothetical protein [Cognatishimia sp.]